MISCKTFLTTRVPLEDLYRRFVRTLDMPPLRPNLMEQHLVLMQRKPQLKFYFQVLLAKPTQGIDVETVSDMDLISLAAASVCLIGTYGTGFRVGDKCIMTAAHVLQFALEIQDGEILDVDFGERSSCFKRCVQKKLNSTELHVYAHFTHGRDCYYKLTTLRYVDIHLDTAVVELAPSTDGNPFPQAFTRFRGDYKGRFSLIGHVGDRKLYREHNCYTITEREVFQRMKIELWKRGIKPDHLEIYDKFGTDSSFLEFHCSLTHGASGSPGFVVHHGEVCVVTMLQAGYPENPSDIPIDPRLCVEQGVTMTAIYQHIKSTDKELHQDIFG
ncbi:uncharacterized protein LOC124271447 isoform X2 [Haliotis rubra]|uniref:uncharacterized protein LOC124271447 isoform X2 n=1 Tax=Haliotis rubra TaxID=36100 RepID=UPI001EE5D398|nr:uncharacterized protein LOC124271447 isoform X2 [Haliotis rubra]